MTKYLLNKVTKVISVSGDMTVGSYEEAAKVYEDVFAEEVEIENGFMLKGIRVNGEEFEAILSIEEYFEGKEFKLN